MPSGIVHEARSLSEAGASAARGGVPSVHECGGRQQHEPVGAARLQVDNVLPIRLHRHLQGDCGRVPLGGGAARYNVRNEPLIVARRQRR